MADGEDAEEATTKNTKNTEVFWEFLVRYRG